MFRFSFPQTLPLHSNSYCLRLALLSFNPVKFFPTNEMPGAVLTDEMIPDSLWACWIYFFQQVSKLSIIAKTADIKTEYKS